MNGVDARNVVGQTTFMTNRTATTTIRKFVVGGFVRDTALAEINGTEVQSKDVDFAVEAESFAAMRDHLVAEGFTIFVEKEEFLTIRAKVPAGSPLAALTHDADFVLCRKDGPTADGRRPEFVEAGTLADDLARRDFTVNAMAMDEDGNLVDPFGGRADLEAGLLRFVGDGAERVREDGLRVLRGFRFMVTKGLTAAPETHEVLTSLEAATMLGAVSKERVRDELDKMFKHDTLATLNLLGTLPAHTVAAMFPEGLRLAPTMKK